MICTESSLTQNLKRACSPKMNKAIWQWWRAAFCKLFRVLWSGQIHVNKVSKSMGGWELSRVSPAARCPVLWKGWWALVSEAIHDVWCESASRPALADGWDCCSCCHVVWETEPEMQMAEMSPHTVLFCRRCTKSVFHLANTPPEL